MKKVINNRMYDTDTAKELGSWSNESLSIIDDLTETLYLKRTGEYFLLGEGGARTIYAKRTDDRASSGSRIIPLDYDQAKTWAADHLDADDYLRLFGNPEEEDGNEILSLSLPKAAANKLRQEAQRQGMSLSGYIASLADLKA